MTHHAHHDSAKQHGHGREESKKIGIHKDWRLWIGVLLMLGAILVYVFTQDDSEVPAANPQPVPAAGAAMK
jgi:hypothetical protein